MARDGKDVTELLANLTPLRAQEIGLRALDHVLNHHTYASRAAEVDQVLRAELAARRRRSVA